MDYPGRQLRRFCTGYERSFRARVLRLGIAGSVRVRIVSDGSKSIGQRTYCESWEMTCIGGAPSRLLKGAAAIVFARWFYPWFYTLPSVTPLTAHDLQTWVPWAVCVAELAVLMGHIRSIWLNFTVGKSAATGLGVLLTMFWPVGLGAETAVGVVLAIFRIVSLSSMLAALTAISSSAAWSNLALSVTDDCRQHLRDCAPSCQHSAAALRRAWGRAAEGKASSLSAIAEWRQARSRRMVTNERTHPLRAKTIR